jgi:Na+-driven multidrug efflux pump
MSYLFIPEHGAGGLALAQCVSYFVTSIICVIYIYIVEKEFMTDTGIVQ